MPEEALDSCLVLKTVMLATRQGSPDSTEEDKHAGEVIPEETDNLGNKIYC